MSLLEQLDVFCIWSRHHQRHYKVGMNHVTEAQSDEVTDLEQEPGEKFQAMICKRRSGWSTVSAGGGSRWGRGRSAPWGHSSPVAATWLPTEQGDGLLCLSLSHLDHRSGDLACSRASWVSPPQGSGSPLRLVTVE